MGLRAGQPQSGETAPDSFLVDEARRASEGVWPLSGPEAVTVA
jgi:hypothetical protein